MKHKIHKNRHKGMQNEMHQQGMGRLLCIPFANFIIWDEENDTKTLYCSNEVNNPCTSTIAIYPTNKKNLMYKFTNIRAILLELEESCNNTKAKRYKKGNRLYDSYP